MATASDRMRRHGIRNLPVVHEGKLCGVLSERDVLLAESLSAVELAHLSVGAAMGRDLYPVTQSTPLSHVVRTMAAHGYGCAVVMEREVVLGVFGATDALRVLSLLLDSDGEPHRRLDANQARAVVLTEHAHVDALLLRSRRAVHRLRSSRDPERDACRVREQACHLRDAIRSYLELEARELTPVLCDLAGSGTSCFQRLAQERVRQIADTAAIASVLDDQNLPPSSLAGQLEHLLSNLGRDLEREHALLFAMDDESSVPPLQDAPAD